MKIDEHSARPGQGISNSDPKESTVAAGQSKSTTGGADMIMLSDTTSRIGRALDIIRSLPEIRKERVATMTQQLESGDYAVSSREVAEKMLRELISWRR